jgi:hypothetical protein
MEEACRVATLLMISSDAYFAAASLRQLLLRPNEVRVAASLKKPDRAARREAVT